MPKQIKIVQMEHSELQEMIGKTVEEKLSKALNDRPKFTQEGEEILPRKDAAKLLGISLSTLHDWVNMGVLKPYKLSNRTFFKRSEIINDLSNSNRSKQ